MADSPDHHPRPTSKPAIFPDDGRIFHRHGIGYQVAERVLDFSADRRGVSFRLGLHGSDSPAEAELRIEVFDDQTFRLKFGPPDAVFEERSPMLVAEPLAEPVFTVRETTDFVEIALAEHQLRIGLATFTLEIYREKLRIFALETEQVGGAPIAPPLGYRADSEGRDGCFFSWRIANADRFFGLGEKWNKVEKSSTQSTIWSADTRGTNTNDLSYKAIPLLYCTAGWGLFSHAGHRSRWEVGSWSYTAGSCLVEAPHLDLFLFTGESLAALIGIYTRLTGRPALPPRWALGTWISRCAFANAEEAEAAMQGFREREIPADVVHLDPTWLRGDWAPAIGRKACNFVWNDRDFPDHTARLHEWSEAGWATSCWINPCLPEETPIYREAQTAGYLVRDESGAPIRPEDDRPVGLIDFTHPAARDWWKRKLRELFEAGIWVTKPADGDHVPEHARFHDGSTGEAMHNLYLQLYAQASYEATHEARGEALIWRKAGTIGSQRYPGTWAGDTQVSWEAFRCCLRGGLSAGLSGEAWWASDIGGYRVGKPSPELYIRWAQFGFFSGLTRFHGDSPREPWEYGEEAVEVVKRYARLRYSLIPYLLACGHESATRGLPLMRHMHLEFPEDPGTEYLDDQYMLGPDLLVAPVLEPGCEARMIYFPAGTWMHLEDPFLQFEGPRFHQVPTPLGKLPLFARPGAILPRYRKPPLHLKGEVPTEWRIDLYPPLFTRSLTVPETEFSMTIDLQAEGNAARVQVDPTPVDVHLVPVEFPIPPALTATGAVVDAG